MRARSSIKCLVFGLIVHFFLLLLHLPSVLWFSNGLANSLPHIWSAHQFKVRVLFYFVSEAPMHAHTCYGSSILSVWLIILICHVWILFIEHRTLDNFYSFLLFVSSIVFFSYSHRPHGSDTGHGKRIPNAMANDRVEMGFQPQPDRWAWACKSMQNDVSFVLECDHRISFQKLLIGNGFLRIINSRKQTRPLW